MVFGAVVRRVAGAGDEVMAWRLAGGNSPHRNIRKQAGENYARGAQEQGLCKMIWLKKLKGKQIPHLPGCL